MKALLWLVGATAVFWALVTYPARLLAERNQWEAPELTSVWSATAALVSLLPAALTLLWTRRAYAGQPEQQLLAVMGGTTARMAFAIAAGLILFFTVPEFAYQRFWVFLVLFYLFTLALEIILIVRSTAAKQALPKN